MTMMDHDNRPRDPRASRNSPTAWIIGAISILAVLAVALFYDGGGISSDKTTADPNTAPNVVTGSNTSRK
jgi:hypothetical protein